MKFFLLVIPCLVLLCGCTAKIFQSDAFQKPEFSALTETLDDEGKRLEKLPVPLLIQEGREYLGKGNMAIARLHFLVALKKDQNSAAAWTGFADVQSRTDDPRRAESAYQAALQKIPDYLPALLGLGRLRRGTGNIEGALAILQETREKHPENEQALSELAITLDEAGQHQEAELLHRKAAGLRPDSASASNNLGFHYLIQERYPDAVTALLRSVKSDPRNEVARNNLAVAYVLSGETEKAFSLFQNTVGEPAAWNNIGYLLMTHGKRDLAEKAFRQALDSNPRFYSLAKRNLDELSRLEIVQEDKK